MAHVSLMSPPDMTLGYNVRSVRMTRSVADATTITTNF